MSSIKASSVRSKLLLQSGNLSRLILWLITEDRLLKVTSTPCSKSLMYKKEKYTSASPIMWPQAGVRKAQSSDCVLPRAGARNCEDNHWGLEGEHWAQCASVWRCREEHTLTERQSSGPSNDSGLGMVRIPDPPRVRQTDTIIVFLLIHIVFCHVSSNLPIHCLFYVIMNI